MKKNLYLVCLILSLCLHANSQTSVFKIVDAFSSTKSKSLSMQGYGCYDQSNKNSFILQVVTGLTVFNTKNELILIDKKKFTEKAKISYPKFEGYDDATTWPDNKVITAETKDNVIFFFKKKDKSTKRVSLYGCKFGDSLILPDKPEFLFSFQKKETDLVVDVNHNKSLILLQNKYTDKTNSINFFRLFDSNLKLIHTDSTETLLRASDIVKSIILENGYLVVKQDELKQEFILYDVITNKKYNFALNGNYKNPIVTNARMLNGKIILCGHYFSEKSKNLITNGIFKIVYNLTSNQIEDEVYFDHIPKGQNEDEIQRKFIETSYINSKGDCFVVLHQNTLLVGGSTSTSFKYAKSKYEIMGITNENEKWRKQLPLGLDLYKSTYFTENNIYVVCYVNDKHDFNNFIYENPFIISKNRLKLSIDAYYSILKVTPDGIISNNRITTDVEDSTENNRWIITKNFKGKLKTHDFDFLITECYE